MFHYMLIFVLVSATNICLGMPAKQSNDTLDLYKSFTALANNCNNTFISSEIRNQINECNCTVPPLDSNKKLLCLIFYDINSQLCKAVNSGLIINEDNTHKLNKTLSINDVCELAKKWNVSDTLGKYGKLKITIDNVFKSPLICTRQCGTSIIESADANYHCKYYQWGFEMLHSQISALSSQANNVVGNIKTSEVSIPHHTDVNNDNKFNVTLQQVPNITNTNSFNKSTTIDNKLETNKTTVQSETQKNILVSDMESIKSEDVTNKKGDNGGVNQPMKQSNPAFDNPESVIDNSLPKLQNGDIDTIGESAEGKDYDIEADGDPTFNKEAQLNSGDVKKIETPVSNIEEPQKDIEETKDDGIYENELEGGDQIASNMGTKIYQKTSDIKKIENPVPNLGETQKEYYPIQEGFADDDDNFFPFFLTVVILVVLLYVLYHNKNKVSKLFFGLLVEGRQSGRRRNSRGHAYRRLDTLEQAMSTNTAAPPSKIIY